MTPRTAITKLKNMRLWVMWIAAAAVIALHAITDPDGGLETQLRLLWLLWLIVLAGPVYLLRRAFTDRARFQQAYDRAVETPTGAGLVVIGLCLLMGLLFLAFANRSAAAVPDRAVEYLPVLDREITARWPQHPLRSVLGALVEQETCPSLEHRKCWNPRTELKTEREYGFGLGQTTVAYHADGSERFNRWAELRREHPDLAGWSWEDRFNPAMQLRAIVLDSRGCFLRIGRLVEDRFNALAFCDAAYNGGFGGMLGERRLCAAVTGCDPDQWFGHVEHHSGKSRQPWRGYGKSAFEINREHVRNVMQVRRAKYTPLMETS